MKIENQKQLNVFIKIAYEGLMELFEKVTGILVHQKELEMRVRALENKKDVDDWWKEGGKPSEN